MQRNWIELRPKNISFTSLSASASKSQNSLRRCNLFEVNGALHIQMEFIGGERLFSTVSFQGEEKILKATESENGPLFKSHSSTRLNSRRRWWSTFTDEALADNATLAPQLTYFLTLELAAQWVMQVLHKLNRPTVQRAVCMVFALGPGVFGVNEWLLLVAWRAPLPPTVPPALVMRPATAVTSSPRCNRRHWLHSNIYTLVLLSSAQNPCHLHFVMWHFNEKWKGGKSGGQVW